MSSQYYRAEVHVRAADGGFLTVYNDGPGPVGLSASQVRTQAEAVARAEVPGGTVVGSRVSTDGKVIG
ncbi:hypothetical protein ACFV1L_14100 [Kitasatospora sp. NPDC059646]|uniref:hypothetical protein n=1 Tax=Kitasatospora sp. NPDC059646 TaxID=3346893 RepID=UPI003680E986